MDDGSNTADKAISSENHRDAQRFALLIRTAKLVCDTGEYLCIVRDISASGVRLRLFHPMPASKPSPCNWRTAIPIRWNVCGTATTTPDSVCRAIDVHEFMEEPSKWPRRPIRLHFHIPAMVIADDSINETIVHNISRYGARIETDRYLALQQKMILDSPGRGADQREYLLAFGQALRPGLPPDLHLRGTGEARRGVAAIRGLDRCGRRARVTQGAWLIPFRPAKQHRIAVHAITLAGRPGTSSNTGPGARRSGRNALRCVGRRLVIRRGEDRPGQRPPEAGPAGAALELGGRRE